VTSHTIRRVEFNRVEEIFGAGTVADVISVIVGFAGLMMIPRRAAKASWGRARVAVPCVTRPMI
jgi:uncharacterized membrane protein YuzA (DUF378 family)